jgi:YD repeat-containing protein
LRGRRTLTAAYLYDGQLRPRAQLNASGTVTAEFVYANGINVPDAILTGGKTYALLRDHLGSVRLVVDAQTGAIAQQISYDAFGQVTEDTSPGFQPFGFAGGLYDADTGLVHFGARD